MTRGQAARGDYETSREVNEKGRPDVLPKRGKDGTESERSDYKAPRGVREEGSDRKLPREEEEMLCSVSAADQELEPDGTAPCGRNILV